MNNNTKHLINLIKPDKSVLRKKFKEIRKLKHDYLESNTEEKAFCNKNLQNNLIEIIERHSKNFSRINISCYVPIKDEIDCLTPLVQLKKIYETKGTPFTICLPKTIENERGLRFYEYNEECLINGKYNLKEPDPTKCKEIIPYFVVTPLLSFDRFKHRLGYGKGYYDNTFLKLKNMECDYVSIGIAYEELFYEEELPVDKYDQHLSYVVTPDKIF